MTRVEGPYGSIILAAGKSLRMGRLCDRRPKHFLPLLNVPLIERHIAALWPYAPVLISHSQYKQEVFEAYVAQHHAQALSQGRLALHLNPLRVEGPLFPFVELIHQNVADGRRDVTIIGAAGDAYSRVDLTDLLRFHRSHDRAITIAATRSFPTPKAFIFEVDNGLLMSAARTDGSSSSMDLINLGLYVAGREILDVIGMDLPSYKEDVVIDFLAKRRAAAVYTAPDGSVNINTPYNLLLANLSALKRLCQDDAGERTVGGELNVEDRVLKDEDVEVHGSARMRDVVLAGRVRVGSGSRLQNVLVLAGARVGEDVALTNVIVGEEAVVPNGKRLRGAVIVEGGLTEPMTLLIDPSQSP